MFIMGNIGELTQLDSCIFKMFLKPTLTTLTTTTLTTTTNNNNTHK